MSLQQVGEYLEKKGRTVVIFYKKSDGVNYIQTWQNSKGQDTGIALLDIGEKWASLLNEDEWPWYLKKAGHVIISGSEYASAAFSGKRTDVEWYTME